MSPERDIVLRCQYIDLLWELHQLATAGALSEAEYHLQKGIILGRMSALWLQIYPISYSYLHFVPSLIIFTFMYLHYTYILLSVPVCNAMWLFSHTYTVLLLVNLLQTPCSCANLHVRICMHAVNGWSESCCQLQSWWRYKQIIESANFISEWKWKSNRK